MKTHTFNIILLFIEIVAKAFKMLIPTKSSDIINHYLFKKMKYNLIISVKPENFNSTIFILSSFQGKD